MSGFWTKFEKEILEENYQEKTIEELRELLPNRSPHAIRVKLNRMGLYPDSRTCRHCGKKFKPRVRNQIYCNQECGQKEFWYRALKKAREGERKDK